MANQELHIEDVFSTDLPHRAQTLQQLADTWLRMAARQASA